MDDHFQLKQLYNSVRKVNQERYAVGSKKRLIQNIEKKFKTAMIGSLARCEERLGFLWGHEQEVLTTEQKQYKILWENLRTEILNHCNSQMRTALEEIMQYHIIWNQYHTDFIIKKDK